MKKLFVILAAAFAMVACQTDINEVGVAVDGVSTVEFEVGAPQMRSYSDGSTATKLQYAVYEVKADQPLNYLAELTVAGDEAKTLDGGKANVKIELANNKKYAVIFWASAAVDGPYEVNFETKQVTVTYGGNCNDESRDAFYAYKEFEVKGAATLGVELRRPFAQLNLGASDFEAAGKSGYVPSTSALVVKSACNVLNLETGVASGEVTAEFGAYAVPTGETFPVDGYNYLAMSYVLVDNSTYDVEYTVTAVDGTAISHTVGSVPMKTNHRTNIYGKLLTSSTDINVEINPDYEEPDYEQNLLPWDGTYTDTTWYNDTDTEFTLNHANQLAGLKQLVDEGITFEGKTIKLNVDVDLCAKDENGNEICFDPIGSNKFDQLFKGTFDGQNHTIRNLSQNYRALNNGWDYNDCGLGLFGFIDGGTVKNLKVDNAKVYGDSSLCGIIAAVAQNATFENITVTNSLASDYQYYSGGIVALILGRCNFIGCNVDASTTIAAQWGDFDNSTGGIAGGVYGSTEIYMKDCTVACRIDAYSDITSTYQWWAYRRCGMLIGNSGATKTVDGVTYADAPQLTCENVKVIYGDWVNYTYCEFAGTSWPWVRVQAGVTNSAYSNPRYGHPTDANGNTVVDDNHTHNPGEGHHALCRFDQLYGGGQGVYGTRTHAGVTIDYPYSVAEEATTGADVINAIKAGQNVKLATDVNVGTTQLALDNVKIDLNGHTLTTSNNWGGISLKNGAAIKNGTITHAGNTAAIKAFNGTSVENVTINATCSTADKTVTGIAVQQGANVESIKNVTINGVSQGIEVGYQATVGLIEKAVVNESNNGTAKGIGLVINGGKVGQAKDCTFKGETCGITMHLKGEFAVGLELENCKVEGTTASIYAWDEKGISNTNNCSLTLTYDAATVLTGPFVWDFEDECKSVVTLNKPQ